MASIFVQADDFSGAAEVGSFFTGHGLTVQVHLAADGSAPVGAGTQEHDGDTSKGGEGTDVLIADTHSRGRSEAMAETLVIQAFTSPAAKTAEHAFKKIDSLWRGNVAAEIRAILGLGYSVLVAGALPQLQRTVRGGQPFVQGVPLARTDLWRAEQTTPPSSIAALLRPEAPATVSTLDLDTVRSPGLPDKLASLLDGNDPVAIVADGETVQDLHLAVQALLTLDDSTLKHRVVLVGTGGTADVLAGQLAGQLARNAHSAQSAGGTTTRPQEPNKPVLAVVGSASSAAKGQLAELEARGFSVTALDLPSLMNLPSTESASDAQLHWIRRALGSGANAALAIAAADVDPGKADAIVRGLAKFAADALAGIDADLILTGGETAREVLDAVGIRRLSPLNAVQHGTVLSRADTGTLVGTKPGSFGDHLALSQLYDEIREQHGQAARTPTNPSARTPSKQTGANMTTVAPENKALPVVAVTMGDGAGVGPEVVVAAALDPQSNAECRPVVIGDALRLRQAADILGIEADIQVIQDVEDAVFTPGRVNVIDLALLPEDLAWGQLSPIAGHAAYEYIRVASELAMAGRVQAICTAPLNKEALHAAGHIFPGHTELLAQLTGTEEVSMMLSTPKIRVIHVTTHIGLMDAVRKIEPGLVERTIRRGHEALVRAGIPNPKIGVCAINPHAGENGLFGQGEEAEKIEPGVKAAQAEGINAVGPLPADTLFFLAGRGDYDLVVAMYHDQGHGPVKVLGIEAGVNITVGLPVIRTSVDHGTAFDIAGKAIADSRSMVEALHQAAEMATRPSVAV